MAMTFSSSGHTPSRCWPTEAEHAQNAIRQKNNTTINYPCGSRCASADAGIGRTGGLESHQSATWRAQMAPISRAHVVIGRARRSSRQTARCGVL